MYQNTPFLCKNSKIFWVGARPPPQTHPPTGGGHPGGASNSLALALDVLQRVLNTAAPSSLVPTSTTVDCHNCCMTSCICPTSRNPLKYARNNVVLRIGCYLGSCLVASCSLQVSLNVVMYSSAVKLPTFFSLTCLVYVCNCMQQLYVVCCSFFVGYLQM